MAEKRKESLVEKPERKKHQVILDKEETAGLDLLREGMGFRKMGPTIRAAVKYCIKLHRLGKLDLLNQRFRRKKEENTNASEPNEN